MIKFLFALAALSASTCEVGPFPKPAPQPEPPEPAPYSADASPPLSPGSCAAACAHGEAMHCAWARPTPAGATCTEVCQNAETSGELSFGPDCAVHARACDDAYACAYAVPRQ